MYRAIALILFLTSGLLIAEEPVPAYGEYNLRDLMVVSRDKDGKENYGLDLKLLDTILRDLEVHANDYPPKFASEEDLKRATFDAKTLSKMFGSWIAAPTTEANLLFKFARLNTFAHNLDIPGSIDAADECYVRLLKQHPKNPMAHYGYGSFLASTGNAKGIQHLEQAVSLGYHPALKPLAMAHLAQGQVDKAKARLNEQLAKDPNDQMTITILTAIRQGKIRIKGKSQAEKTN